MDKTNHVRTVMTIEGNTRKELSYIGNNLQRVKRTTGEWQNGIRTVTRDTTRFNHSAGGMSKALNGAALRFIGITALISGASQAFQKLNQWITTSVESFRAFENSMAEVSTILTGESYQAIATLTKGVEELSIKYGQSAIDMSRGLYQILSAAVDVEKSINMLNIATKASIAGLTSVETSVDVLTSIINSYGKSVEQAAGMSDVLFQTVVRGKLRFEDLASSLGYITPIAAAAGVAFQEISAALATVTRMGLHVDMASRGLALTIQNIVSPTKQAREAADEFGVDMSAVGIRVFGLQGFIQDLSSAVKEFGLAVLPRMVRNMRSLRVVMALVSEEGIKGFAEDLDLMYASTGRTNEALAKMISTQQREAAVVKQSQEIINRSIGETWSPIKRNIEATKLWFTTFIAGGLSIGRANRAIQELSETLDKNRDKINESIEAMGKWGQQSIFTQLFDMEDYDPGKIDEVVQKVTDMGKVRDYLIAQSRTIAKEDYGDKNVFDWATGKIEVQIEALEQGGTFFIGGVKNLFNTVSGAFDEIDTVFDINQNPLVQFKSLLQEVDDVAGDNITTMQDNADAFNAFWSAIDTAREHVFNFKTNVLELQNAIASLSTEVSDVYTSLAGEEHKGTLGMAIDIKSFDTATDRLKGFSTMIKKYGSEWEDMFYDIFEGRTYSVGDEEISYIDEYDTELKAAVNTVYSFKEAQKEVKKVMNEVNKAIMLNNIAIAELQLKGMMRRRGLTRTEEKTIKKLQIANMKERLKQKKAEQEAMSDTDKQEYDEAGKAISKYFDSQEFYHELMKDARDDDLAHMVSTFDRKEKLLTHYQEALTIQEGYLEKAHQIEIDLLIWVQEEFPTIASLYEDIYGISIPESIQKSIDAMDEWNVLQGKEPTGTIYSPKERAEELQESSEDEYKKRKEKYTIIKVEMPPFKIGEKLQHLYTSSSGAQKRANPGTHKYGDTVSFSRGIEYAPKTMLATIHEGESVIPAGRQRGDDGNGKVTIEHVTIQVKEIAEIGSAEKVAAVLSEAADRRIISTGTPRARNKKAGNTYRVI